MRYSTSLLILLLATFSNVSFCFSAGQQKPSGDIPSWDVVARAKTDIWGEAALRQENGPSYEFFEKLLPPLRYDTAKFEHYPLVLSAPRHIKKARFVSNGSGINLWANDEPRWHEVGIPITFRVGDREELYGRDLARLDGPRFYQGYLPVVQLSYEEHGCLYNQEAFLSTDPDFADYAAIFVRFSVPAGNTGEITAHVNPHQKICQDGKLRLKFRGRSVLTPNGLTDSAGRYILWTGGGQWRWDANWNLLKADISHDQDLYLVVFTEPNAVVPEFPLTAEVYQEHRDKTIKTWQDILDRGMQVETPEAVVNNAWRSMLIGSFSVAVNNRMYYSAHNQYQALYVPEGSDAVRSLMLWGFLPDAYEMLTPLLKYHRKDLQYQHAGEKLMMLNMYYRLSRDMKGIEAIRELWKPEVERIIKERDPNSGLFPCESYCCDIKIPVNNLRSNAVSWRGLRDTSVMLEDMGQDKEAKSAAVVANEYRSIILEAVKKSEYKNTTPPFIPLALFGEEKPYDVLTADKAASYYNLVVSKVIASSVLGLGSEREDWMVEYLQQHGGLCMGMIRSRSTAEYWVNKSNVVDMYTRHYVTTLLRRDDVERALVSFYGKLAQGCTRDTFTDGEASCLAPKDKYGRQLSLPPNTNSNAFFLWMLRYLLVQDWDLDDDGRPDTLRLMYATPRRWLMDGKTIKVAHAPTAFGEVSVTMKSDLKNGQVIADVVAPPRPCPRMLLRARLPQGWKVVSGLVDGKTISADETGAVDIPGKSGMFTVYFTVERNP